jgi:hypothetical protein
MPEDDRLRSLEKTLADLLAKYEENPSPEIGRMIRQLELEIAERKGIPPQDYCWAASPRRSLPGRLRPYTPHSRYKARGGRFLIGGQLLVLRGEPPEVLAQVRPGFDVSQ